MKPEVKKQKQEFMSPAIQIIRIAMEDIITTSDTSIIDETTGIDLPIDSFIIT